MPSRPGAVRGAVLLALTLLAGCSSPAAPPVTLGSPGTPTPAAAGSTSSPAASSTEPASSESAQVSTATPTAAGRPAATLSPTPARSATPRPSTRRTPTATPKPSVRSGAPAVRTAKKGAALWDFDGVQKAIGDSGVSWYYTWSSGPGALSGVRGAEFVPMIWGAGSADAGSLARAKATGHTLLGFNEPDLAGQADMTVEQALALWPKLQATGLPLASPVVAANAATPGGWLDRFMSGAAARGYRVDVIAVHWYGGDFATANAVRQLRDYLTAINARYHRPIWLTEYALMRFGPTVTPDAGQQAAFVTASTAMLESLPFVQRYAWFAFPTPKEGGLGTGLYSPGGVQTEAGKAYRAARPQ